MKKILIVALMITAGFAQAETVGESKQCASKVSEFGYQLVTFHKLGTPRVVVASKYTGQVQDWALGVYDIMNRNEPKGGYVQRDYDKIIQSMVRGTCY
jgi:hypothetical protein